MCVYCNDSLFSLRAVQLAQFLEEEAELSGCDDGSSEDDENSDMDEYEANAIADEETALLSSIELQRQVEKIHQYVDPTFAVLVVLSIRVCVIDIFSKEMLMQDREDVEAFKERYLGGKTLTLELKINCSSPNYFCHAQRTTKRALILRLVFSEQSDMLDNVSVVLRVMCQS